MHRLLVGLLVVLALFVPAAGADDKSEELETSGDRGPLEIAAWSISHERKVLVHELRFVGDFDPAWLEGGGPSATVVFFVETSDDRERLIWLEPNPDGSLLAKVRGGRQTRGFANVWMPDSQTVRVEFSEVSLWRRLRAYRWAVRTFYFEEGHEDCGDPHPDIVDDAGCIDFLRGERHRL